MTKKEKTKEKALTRKTWLAEQEDKAVASRDRLLKVNADEVEAHATRAAEKQAAARATLNGSVEQSSSPERIDSGSNVVAAQRQMRPLKALPVEEHGDETRASADLLPDGWRWDGGPCSSPESPVSHTWRLLDQVTYPREIWYGGIVLVSARCAACGARAKFSEGAWETTEALGDGPCPDPRSDAASHYPRHY